MSRIRDAADRLSQTWQRTDDIGRFTLALIAIATICFIVTGAWIAALVACVAFVIAVEILRVHAMSLDELLEEIMRLQQRIDRLRMS